MLCHYNAGREAEWIVGTGLIRPGVWNTARSFRVADPLFTAGRAEVVTSINVRLEDGQYVEVVHRGVLTREELEGACARTARLLSDHGLMRLLIDGRGADVGGLSTSTPSSSAPVTSIPFLPSAPCAWRW